MNFSGHKNEKFEEFSREIFLMQVQLQEICIYIFVLTKIVHPK